MNHSLQFSVYDINRFNDPIYNLKKPDTTILEKISEKFNGVDFVIAGGYLVSLVDNKVQNVSKESDIDVFLFGGCTMNRKTNLENLSKIVLDDSSIYNISIISKSIFEFNMEDIPHKIQVIFTNNESPFSFVNQFDLSCSQIMWYKSKIFATKHFINTCQTRLIKIINNSRNLNRRIKKYSLRHGFINHYFDESEEEKESLHCGAINACFDRIGNRIELNKNEELNKSEELNESESDCECGIENECDCDYIEERTNENNNNENNNKFKDSVSNKESFKLDLLNFKEWNLEENNDYIQNKLEYYKIITTNLVYGYYQHYKYFYIPELTIIYIESRNINFNSSYIIAEHDDKVIDMFGKDKVNGNINESKVSYFEKKGFTDKYHIKCDYLLAEKIKTKNIKKIYDVRILITEGPCLRKDENIKKYFKITSFKSYESFDYNNKLQEEIIKLKEENEDLRNAFELHPDGTFAGNLINNVKNILSNTIDNVSENESCL